MNFKKYFLEVIGLKYLFFRKISLLKLNYTTGTSIKTTFLSDKFYNNIYQMLEQEKDFIGSDSMWLDIYNKHHFNFLNYVKKDKNKLKYALDNPSKFNLFYGFDSNCDIFKKKPRYLDKFENTLLVIDQILSFSEFLGIIRLNNPERFSLKNKKPDLENLIDQIEKKLNIELKFNNVFPGETGIKTKRGIVTTREVQAIYQAYKIKKIIEHNNFQIKNILEIGGGLGRTAYYSYKLGIKNYTLVDILIPRICQLNYLSRVINEQDVLFQDEAMKFSNDEKIKILSPNSLFSNNIKYDLVFNSDSFTEIDINNQKKYSDYIIKNSKFFFSINHESNKNKVTEFFPKKNIKIYEKNLYWLRKGYLEENFLLNN